MIAIKDVLVATDFSPASETALAYGRELARHFGGTLHVLHVVENVYAYMVGTDAAIGAMIPSTLQQELEKAAQRSSMRRSATTIAASSTRNRCC